MYGGTELPLAECPDLDSESGNRTDKWQITERGKSYIQADAVLETPQPVLLTLHKNCPIERYLTITIATLSLNQLRHLQWLISAIMKALRKPSYVCPRGQLPSLAQLSPVCESKTNKKPSRTVCDNAKSQTEPRRGSNRLSRSLSRSRNENSAQPPSDQSSDPDKS